MNAAARDYGQALYDLARAEELSAQIMAGLDELTALLTAEPGLGLLLSSPAVPKRERLAVIDHAFRNRFHPYVVHFLKILTEKGDFRHFLPACAYFRQEYRRDRGILTATAVTAVPLQKKQRQQLEETLTRLTGKTIRLECRIDPDCLGGIRLELGERVIDSTLRTRLEDLGKSLSTP